VIRGATVTNLTSATDRDGTITDATGSVALRLDNNALATFPLGTFEAGKCYDITGILGIFNGTAQLKPRVRTDVAEVTCP
jgi:DNA/RNA endonuclease YhcR with UshA esterase domain